MKKQILLSLKRKKKKLKNQEKEVRMISKLTFRRRRKVGTTTKKERNDRCQEGDLRKIIDRRCKHDPGGFISGLLSLRSSAVDRENWFTRSLRSFLIIHVQDRRIKIDTLDLIYRYI